MAQPDRPNILLIMTDQHSPAAMGCAGHPFVRTPHMDRLAREGMRFTDTYCPAPLCVPSRMSFMTCRTPSHNQVWDNRGILSSALTTWPTVLGAAGYETALIGRMHFVGSDQRHGFLRRPIGEFMSGHPGAKVRGGPMWQHFPMGSSGQSRTGVEVAGHGHTHYQWSDEQCTDKTVAYLREHARNPGRPFAAVLGYLLPHCPFIALRELFEYYLPRTDVPAVEANQPATITRLRKNRKLLDPPLPDERVRLARAAYFGMVEHADRMIGRVLAALDETGLADNTLVIYCSDHGEMAGEHGCWWKSSYYRNSVSVPMIARLPGVVPAGATSQAVCNLMDLGVTFADIAGRPFDGPTDGRSLWPTLQGRHPANWVDETFSEFIDTQYPAPSPSRMIRRGPWKLWVHDDGDRLPPALFHVENDPDELHDLSNNPQYADVRRDLLARVYADWRPRENLQIHAERLKSYHAAFAWGQALDPEHPDALTMAPADYEADVQLL